MVEVRTPYVVRAETEDIPIRVGVLKRRVEPDWLKGLDWAKKAACSGMGAKYFYPETKAKTDSKKALAACGRCNVRRECLLYAIENGEKHGIWGGTRQVKQRNEIKVRWQGLRGWIGREMTLEEAYQAVVKQPLDGRWLK